MTAKPEEKKTSPIELYLVGGFLGAGKTTFLRQLMLQLGEAKMGLLVNEFGTVSIDGPVLRHDDIEMVEINNGSVFCACLAHGFTKTLKAFSELPIDLLLIESSGMADPSNMPDILKKIEPYLERPYRYAGLITLVDACSFLDYIDIIVALQNQLAAADLILINKSDLVDADTLDMIRDVIDDYRGDIPVLNTTYGRIGLEELRSILTHHGHVSPSYNTPQNRPESWVIHVPDTQTETAMRAFCEALADSTWRIKGFVPAGDDRWIHVDATGRHVVVEPPAPEASGRFDEGILVAIGEPRDGGLRHLIKHAWQETGSGDIAVGYE